VKKPAAIAECDSTSTLLGAARITQSKLNYNYNSDPEKVRTLDAGAALL
jgi:hypothetical protein